MDHQSFYKQLAEELADNIGINSAHVFEMPHRYDMGAYHFFICLPDNRHSVALLCIGALVAIWETNDFHASIVEAKNKCLFLPDGGEKLPSVRVWLTNPNSLDILNEFMEETIKHGRLLQPSISSKGTKNDKGL